MMGSTVTQLVAKDPDEGSNGEVRYTLGSVLPVPFMIDQGTGTVRTTGAFDYDAGTREFSMEVMTTFCVLISHSHTLCPVLSFYSD